MKVFEAEMKKIKQAEEHEKINQGKGGTIVDSDKLAFNMQKEKQNKKKLENEFENAFINPIKDEEIKV